VSIFSEALAQITKIPAPRAHYDMSEFDGLTHVTTKSVAQKLGVSQDSARYHVRRLCETGCLIHDGFESVVGVRSVRKVKRFKIVQGGNHGTEI